MPVAVIGVDVSVAAAIGLIGSELKVIMVDAPMPAKVAGVELIEPIEDIDMPVVELMPVMVVKLMPVMVDAGLIVPDIDDPAGLPKENDIVRPDPDANERETIIPAGI